MVGSSVQVGRSWVSLFFFLFVVSGSCFVRVAFVVFRLIALRQYSETFRARVPGHSSSTHLVGTFSMAALAVPGEQHINLYAKCKHGYKYKTSIYIHTRDAFEIS